MSGHRIYSDLAMAGRTQQVLDPGDAGTITAYGGGVLEIVTTAAETRTLGDPEEVGINLMIFMGTDGGACTFTASSAINDADTTFVMDDVGDMISFVSVSDGSGTYAWKVLGFTGVTGLTEQISGVVLESGGSIDLNGVADSLVLDADQDTTISAPTDDQIDIEAGGVDAVTINASGLQVAGVAVTATTGGGTTGLIPSGASFVTITCDTATKQVTLPANVAGHVIRGMIAATGCEMICADAGAKINDITCGATNEAAIPADTSFICECISSTEWIVRLFTKLGADVAALVPDAL